MNSALQTLSTETLGRDETRSTAWWLWPNLLSLDAPLVAATWQIYSVSFLHVGIRWPAITVLFLTVWIIYIADRLFDTRGDRQPAATARHHFYRVNGRKMALLLGVLLPADTVTATLWLRPVVFWPGLVPFAAVIAYLGLVHRPGPVLAMAKQVAVATLFSAGTLLAAWVGSERALTLAGLFVSLFFLCFANLVAIEYWESGEAGAGLPPSMKWLAQTYLYWVGLLAVGAALFGRSDWYLAIALSAAGLVVLFAAGSRLGADARRVLADAVLLSPILFWIR